jgi:hypothetical protein
MSLSSSSQEYKRRGRCICSDSSQLDSRLKRPNMESPNPMPNRPHKPTSLEAHLGGLGRLLEGKTPEQLKATWKNLVGPDQTLFFDVKEPADPLLALMTSAFMAALTTTVDGPQAAAAEEFDSAAAEESEAAAAWARSCALDESEAPEMLVPRLPGNMR